MAIANADGSIVLTTKVDDSGVKQGVQSTKSQVMKLAAEYKKAGINASDAMKKAWSEVDHTKASTDKATKSTKEYGETAENSARTAKTAMNGAAAAVKKMSAIIIAAIAALKLVQFSKDSSEMAMNVEASTQRIIDIYGEAAGTVREFINANAQALGISKSAASGYAAIYGNLFSAWADGATNAQLTNAYLNMTAVVASKTGRTIEDVQERIRSGLLGNTEAIEDLGIFVNVKTIEMTDAFKKMANGKSWEQLDAYTQQQIRSMAILEQSTSKYGNEVANTMSFARAQFNAAFQEFQRAWGDIFNKILIPILNTLTDILNYATAVLDKLAELTGKTVEQSDEISSSVENQKDFTEEVKRTGKEAKKAFASFDQLNVIAPSESGGTTTGVNSPSIPVPGTSSTDQNQPDLTWIDTTVSAISGMFESLKGKALLYGSLFRPTVTAWKTAFSSVAPHIKTAVEGLGSTAQYVNTEVLQPVSDKLLNETIPTIVNSFSENIAPIIKDLLWLFSVQFPKDVQWGAEKTQTVVDEVITPTMDGIEKVTTDTLDTVGREWDEHGDYIIEQAQESNENTKTIFDNLEEEIISPTWKLIKDGASSLWEQDLKPLWDNLVDFIMNIAENLLTFWNTTLSPFINFIIEKFGPPIVDAFKSIWSSTKTVFGRIVGVISGLIQSLSGLLQFLTGVFSGDWEKAWEGIQKFLKGIINTMIEALNLLWSGIYTALESIVDWFGNIAESAGELIGLDWGWDMPDEPPMIPKLATGAVLPPNKPFLAMLGDQKSGRNLEAPEDLIRQIVREESQSNGHIEVDVNFTGTEARLMKYLSPKISVTNKMRGKNIITGAQA